MRSSESATGKNLAMAGENQFYRVGAFSFVSMNFEVSVIRLPVEAANLRKAAKGDYAIVRIISKKRATQPPGTVLTEEYFTRWKTRLVRNE
jgi:hypothetical protein